MHLVIKLDFRGWKVYKKLIYFVDVQHLPELWNRYVLHGEKTLGISLAPILSKVQKYMEIKKILIYIQ